MKILKLNDLEVIDGYVMSNGKLVYNQEFYEAQKKVQELDKFIDFYNSKNYNRETVIGTTLEEITKDFREHLSKSDKVTYIKEKKATGGEIFDKLTSEALKFVEVTEENESIRDTNELLQEYNIVFKCESRGIPFTEEGIMELDTIYTMDHIVEIFKKINKINKV